MAFHLPFLRPLLNHLEIPTLVDDSSPERSPLLQFVPLPDNSADIRTAHKRLPNSVDAMVDMLIHLRSTHPHVRIVIRVECLSDHVLDDAYQELPRH